MHQVELDDLVSILHRLLTMQNATNVSDRLLSHQLTHEAELLPESRRLDIGLAMILR